MAPRPKGRTHERVTVSLPIPLAERLRSQAVEAGLPFSRLVAMRLASPVTTEGMKPIAASDEELNQRIGGIETPLDVVETPKATVERTSSCPHPKDQRKNLGYMIRCEACGAKLR